MLIVTIFQFLITWALIKAVIILEDKGLLKWSYDRRIMLGILFASLIPVFGMVVLLIAVVGFLSVIIGNHKTSSFLLGVILLRSNKK